ncbi:hypothetical protein RintRC_6688 [Richelia intracellularis]|nr:hypothetical protein RintRC_6688 [Richelia intracellularis]
MYGLLGLNLRIFKPDWDRKLPDMVDYLILPVGGGPDVVGVLK